jgi:hypothetical protein
MVTDSGFSSSAAVYGAMRRGSPAAPVVSPFPARAHPATVSKTPSAPQPTGFVGGYLRNADLAFRLLAGELDPHPESGTFSGQTVAEQILWSGASGRSAEIVISSVGKRWLILMPRCGPSALGGQLKTGH